MIDIPLREQQIDTQKVHAYHEMIKTNIIFLDQIYKKELEKQRQCEAISDLISLQIMS
jgi:hypothetical protein